MSHLGDVSSRLLCHFRSDMIRAHVKGISPGALQRVMDEKDRRTFPQRNTKRVAFNESVLEEKGKVPTDNMAIASPTGLKPKAKVTNSYD